VHRERWRNLMEEQCALLVSRQKRGVVCVWCVCVCVCVVCVCVCCAFALL